MILGALQNEGDDDIANTIFSIYDLVSKVIVWWWFSNKAALQINPLICYTFPLGQLP